MTATAKNGYEFRSWTTNECGTTLTKNCTITANFRENYLPCNCFGTDVENGGECISYNVCSSEQIVSICSNGTWDKIL